MFKREPLQDEPLSDRLRQLQQRGDGFRLPENYLESLKERMPEATATDTPVRPLRRTARQTWLAIAATVVLLLATGGAWLYYSSGSLASDTVLAEADLDALSDEEILAYVEENISDFDLSLLYTEPAQTTEPATETLSDEELDELYYELLE